MSEKVTYLCKFFFLKSSKYYFFACMTLFLLGWMAGLYFAFA
ncbi:hypothetical protein PCARR_a0443 [Pseudoalteromonas carrageenovora IAM 12662]|uniref:Uncharacterized protein n=1 Tax=Pseudoalteromonas carrageenovora IAM 12662 TaxID=1314868 RepID=A0ABR9ENN8_PSEVC|nr:hypothetical protein [Pseudoalteromonas carrageenovora IAM 12662]